MKRALIVFTAGAVLMLALDSTPARIAGVALLFAGIGLGAWAIASPEFLKHGD